MIAALTPDYEPGCKRILVSDDYYPALMRDNVTLIPSATELLHAVGAGEYQVGRSSHCNFPASVESLPSSCTVSVTCTV